MTFKKIERFAASKRILISRLLFFIVLFFQLFTSYNIESTLYHFLLEATGLLLIVAAVFGRFWAGLYIYGYKNNKIITKGPYSIVRNPLYFFSFLGALGISISSKNLIVFSLIMGFLVIYYPWVILNEERNLENKFPQEYKKYKEKVPRFLPRFSLYQEADIYKVNLKKFRKIFFDLVWFFVLYLILDLINILQNSNIIPILINLK